MPDLDLSPLRLFTKWELDRVRHLLRDRDRAHLPRFRHLALKFRVSARRAISTNLQHIRRQRDQAITDAERAEIERLAQAALARELGLHRYMVIRVVRDDGFALQMQALSFSVHDRHRQFASDFAWAISGRRIRKDGTIGLAREHLGIATGTIERRLLDGTWRALTVRRRLRRDED